MAGLYIHVPFCRSRCIYCGFYSTTRSGLQQRYVNALCTEIGARHDGMPTDDTETIYLGGGTPSLLTPAQLHQIFDAIYSIYKVRENAEVTIEVNPDDITVDLASLLADLPVNRVSMGAQTFDDERLVFLHRRHTACQVPQAVDRLRTAGIDNISIDLMYGFPAETLSQWQADVSRALALQVEHLSAYCLTYEEGTPLYRLLEQHKIRETDEGLSLQMYELLTDHLSVAGYEHYEISNFARPGFRSRHNSHYWTDVPYKGLGAAAHSYDRATRQWNPSDISAYIKGIEEGCLKPEGEVIDSVTRYNDRVMLSLRTCEGLLLSVLSDRERAYLLPLAKRHLDAGLLRLSDDRLCFTRKGLFVSDMVTSDLMMV